MFMPKKGTGNNTKLYQTLEVEQTATDDEIKRAYKKMALKYHPDKAPGQEEKFKEISHAYNILSDPQKKEIYDNYGEEGLAFFDNGVFGEDGELLQFMALLQSPITMFLGCMVFMLIWSVATLFPIFIVLKTDGVVDWSWPVVFIPLWIVNIIPAIYTCCLPCSGNSPAPTDEEGAPRPKSRKGKIFSTFIQYFSALAFQILLAIQLETHDYKWSLVFIPIYVFQAFSLIQTLVKLRHSKYREQVDMGIIGVEFGCGYFGYLWKGLVVEALRIVFLILLVVKLENDPYSWWIVSIPIWIGIGWKLFLKTLDDRVLLNGATDEEDRARRRQMVGGLTCLMITVIAFVATFTGLVAAKLDGSSYSVAITFIPIFIILGLIFCCCCCCVPCVMCCMKGDEEEGMNGENNNNNDGPFFEVKKQLYIENKPTESSPLKP